MPTRRAKRTSGHRPGRKYLGARESFYYQQLAKAQRHLNEIGQVLESLGAKLDQAKSEEEIDATPTVERVEELIWSYNDAIESARDAWLRDNLSGAANERLLSMNTPLMYGLPLFTDELQERRAILQGLEISRRLLGRNTVMDRIVSTMQMIEVAVDVAGIVLGGGALITIAKKGGKWALIKTVVAGAAKDAAGRVAEKALEDVGLDQANLGGAKLAALLVKFILRKRIAAVRSGETPPAVAPKQPETKAPPAPKVPPKPPTSSAQGSTAGKSPKPAAPAPDSKVQEGSTGRRRDPKTGRFISDPTNPPSPYKMTDAQRRAEWKRLAQDPNSGLTTEERMEIKSRGWRGPQRQNKFGELETMELSHEPIPIRDGGTNVVPRWPSDHAAIDPNRHLPKKR